MIRDEREKRKEVVGIKINSNKRPTTRGESFCSDA
jgi:hypothetical protein